MRFSCIERHTFHCAARVLADSRDKFTVATKFANTIDMKSGMIVSSHHSDSSFEVSQCGPLASCHLVGSMPSAMVAENIRLLRLWTRAVITAGTMSVRGDPEYVK